MTTSPSQPTHDIRLLHDCRVPMRDGISLSADVYLPLGAQGLSTIVQWTPYESTRERFVAWGAWFARRGYAAVVVDVRGRYESGGTFTAWAYDGQDAHDTLTWAAEEQWSNGRIGTWGRSYGGLVQWQLAHLGHPSLQCIAPQVIHDDYFWDGYWTGGAFQLALTLGAAALWSSAMSLITGPSARDLVLNDRVFGHLPLIELDEVTIGRKVDYWRLWWEHQLNDEYWQRFRHRPERVDVPIFQQGGWFDPYSGSHLRSFAAIGDRLPNRVLIGPWSHEEEVESFRGDIDLAPALTVIRDHELLFYDRFLKDEANGWDERPPAELYVLGANEWRGEREWPLARTEFTAFHLRKGSALAVEAPRPDEPADRYLTTVTGPKRIVGEWHHVAGVLTSDKKMRIYVDGKQAAEVDAPALLSTDPKQPMAIGADENGAVGDYQSPFAFTGVIDEVRVTFAALSDGDVKERFEFPQSQPLAEITVLVDFNDGSARDLSRTRNNGTIEGPEPAEGKVGMALKFKGGANPTNANAQAANRQTGNKLTPAADGAAPAGNSFVEPHWKTDVPIYVRGMVLADRTLFIVGPPDLIDEEDTFVRLTKKDDTVKSQLDTQDKALGGAQGGILLAVNADTGETQGRLNLGALPVWDGLAAARGKMFLTTLDGSVMAFKK